MTPIVNGLEAEFGDRVAFVYLNAADGAEGQQAFDSLSLPGHPSYVLFAPEGSELDRRFGLVETETLRELLQTALAALAP